MSEGKTSRRRLLLNGGLGSLVTLSATNVMANAVKEPKTDMENTKSQMEIAVSYTHLTLPTILLV